MCQDHPARDSAGTDDHPAERYARGFSRRALLAGAGAGVGLALTGLPGSAHAAGAPDAEAAEAGARNVGAAALNGAWCTSAQGRFPAGGHFGAPRGAGPHAGQDISHPIGTAVYAAAAGTVIRRGVGVIGGRTGNGIVIQHAGGVYTYYGHLNAFRVANGARVAAGQRIADMGATGNVTGPHLHFETHSGSLGSVVNPVSFLAARGVDLDGGWPRLNPGAAGQRVRAVQLLLNQRGASLVVDGDYGSVSAAAARSFQAARGLTADGQIGPQTWPALVYSLQQGASGDHVRALQTALNKRSAGLVVDGAFGSVTATAVRTFQGLNQLVRDGLAGPVSWRALVG
ncbi:peptidoglycan DD-metalloendopeptidase family protein [Streptomyces sp. DSM 44915]|uniref:Peptidoglycan DD-metalloendopeptidase family protein n=1 Tax=Streptomyces chisholmiae TaxID=3075540 RepID=A0ABU2JNV8_9ACTN|nr:peptidoglycan DD-metalloendopeptidase family protein [Streptomyces sp. DSM 44915]MDT0266413.1 peptidoglycan DD-metalloendopeptidase family protein [Streptomyces sp. DSM 44915]